MRQDAWALFALALVLRIGVVVWAARRFPPAADGHYYHVLATRLAEGLGYTWLWPDGAVTHAAHYPVGYPALLAAAYALVGAAPAAAMALNALVGALAAPAAYAVSGQVSNRAGALVGGLLVALHPALVLYTPALMTEGVVAALVVVAAWVAGAARRRGAVWVVVLGLLLGAMTLVRPQSLLLAPLLGLVTVRSGAGSRIARAATVTLIAVAACSPWTLRNCQRMDRCVLVSANAGWNLLIGAAPGATGTFSPVADEVVPPECRSVFGEAAKDACFGRAALTRIAERPGAWLSLIPSKLAHTFDFGGASGWYLNASNPRAFSDRARLALAVVETVWQRLTLAFALSALALVPGPRRPARLALGGVSAAALLSPWAWIGYLGLVVQGALLGRALGRDLPAATAVAAVATTALSHAVFFGAGRYSLVTYAATAVLAGTLLRQRGF